jgi:hypothetical protein
MQNVIIETPEEKYKDLETRFLNNFKERNYFFEISKCCGYSEIITCSKTGTLKNLYENVIDVFGKNTKLYVLDDKRAWLPDSNDITVKDYLRETKSLKPEYPLPSNIVYKIFLDDGSCHIDQCNYNPAVFMDICLTCRIHDKKIGRNGATKSI